jgi:two-component system response regulator RegA
MSRVLIVDDDESFARALARGLERAGYATAVALDIDGALREAERQAFDLACIDLRIGEESGLDLISMLKQKQAPMRMLVLTGFASIATAVEATRRGAFDYLTKPVGLTDVINALEGKREDVDIPETPLSLSRMKWEHIQRVLRENDGNVSATARALGVHRRSLQRMLDKKPPNE